jgi:hypothetical protein
VSVIAQFDGLENNLFDRLLASASRGLQGFGEAEVRSTDELVSGSGFDNAASAGHL